MFAEAQQGSRKRTVALVPPVTSAYAGPAALLSSLMCITDKVPSSSVLSHNSDYSQIVGLEPISLKITNNNDVLMQNYITERAMQDTKIKQSQMNRSDGYTLIGVKKQIFVPAETHSVPKAMGLEMFGSDTADELPVVVKIPQPTVPYRRASASPGLKSKVTALVQVENVVVNMGKEILISTVPKPSSPEPAPVIVTVTNTASEKIIESEMSSEDAELAVNKHFEASNIRFGIDTLAEIAASSSKLDTSGRHSPADGKSPARFSQKNPPQITVDPPTTNENSAKSVASEYVKMTSAEYLKAHNPNTIVNGVVTSGTSNFLNITEREITSENASTVASTSDADNNDGMLKLQPHAGASASERGPAAPATALLSARTVVVGESGFKTKSSITGESPVIPFAGKNSAARSAAPFIQDDGGRCQCKICLKTFLKESQLKLHMNIHFVNAKRFFCEACNLNLKTQGRMQKHERSESHKREVMKTSTFGQATNTNPRPFECSDCSIGFRIHGHLAKHLRSKTHVQKLENLQKLPFGTYAEIERAGISLTDIDTTDCENSLASLKLLAQKLLLDKEPGAVGITSDLTPHESRRRTESNSNSEESDIGCTAVANGYPLSPGNSEKSLKVKSDDETMPAKRRKSNSLAEMSEPESIKSP